MKALQILISSIIIITSISCNSTSKVRYNAAYKIVSKDFLSKEASLKEFGKDISGLYIYDSIYPNPLNEKDYSNIYKNILSDKEEIKPLGKDKNLEDLSDQNLNNNWELSKPFNTVFKNIVQYNEIPNGPLNAAIFSEIKDNQLRVDVVPFFVGKPRYCGSIIKYYFKFDKTKIINSKKWKDHYECW
ncbi:MULTISPECIES: hypothetical protein [Chryseobacterium]|uniref:Lipoprotein n=1 Tax=Chryseobacterium candidae TaxID=1978493 RepID=A0ABY2RC61_9FLAO|nr:MULTISPECIES: hypothetical protein [Chryseobacterium]PXW12538.1 hypothetical protein C8D70_1118 [Chryseobacterium sp. CBTAP 102]THV62053.1 hypothetical protein EK417_06475 [Chryseobacterium candidae]SIR73999.1 hypothetical protein SAMN05880573_1421 [Chryseobacterium sp. RU33C]